MGNVSSVIGYMSPKRVEEAAPPSLWIETDGSYREEKIGDLADKTQPQIIDLSQKDACDCNESLCCECEESLGSSWTTTWSRSTFSLSVASGESESSSYTSSLRTSSQDSHPTTKSNASGTSSTNSRAKRSMTGSSNSGDTSVEILQLPDLNDYSSLSRDSVRQRLIDNNREYAKWRRAHPLCISATAPHVSKPYSLGKKWTNLYDIYCTFHLPLLKRKPCCHIQKQMKVHQSMNPQDIGCSDF